MIENLICEVLEEKLRLSYSIHSLNCLVQETTIPMGRYEIFKRVLDLTDEKVELEQVGKALHALKKKGTLVIEGQRWVFSRPEKQKRLVVMHNDHENYKSWVHAKQKLRDEIADLCLEGGRDWSAHVSFVRLQYQLVDKWGYAEYSKRGMPSIADLLGSDLLELKNEILWPKIQLGLAVYSR